MSDGMVDPPREHEARDSYLDRARSDIVRGSVWTAVSTTITLPVSFVASVVAARSLGPDGFGQFATFVAAFAVIGALINLGWSEGTVQWLAAAGAQGRDHDRIDLIRKCSGYHLWIVGPAAAATAFFLLRPSGAATAILGAAIVWTTQAFGTSTVVLSAAARNAVSAQIGLVTSTAAQLALLTAAVASRDPGLTWTVVLGFTLLGPVAAAFALERHERHALFRPKLSFAMPKGFLPYALSACAGGLVSTLVFGRSEVFVLRAHDLVAAAGIFTVATGLASQLTSPVHSLLGPLTPIAAGLFAVDEERAVRLFERSLRVSAVGATVSACLIIPVGVVMIEPLYGADYGSGALPFLVLALVSCTQTSLAPLAAFAFATRSAGRVLRVNLISLSADAALAIGLVPVIGLWGAVVANAASQVISLGLLCLVVSQKLNLPARTIIGHVRLLGIGLLLGTLEGLACSPLEGGSRAFSPVIAGMGLAALFLILRLAPSLRLPATDLALISHGRTNRIVVVGVELMTRTGIVRREPVTHS